MFPPQKSNLRVVRTEDTGARGPNLGPRDQGLNLGPRDRSLNLGSCGVNLNCGLVARCQHQTVAAVQNSTHVEQVVSAVDSQ